METKNRFNIPSTLDRLRFSDQRKHIIAAAAVGSVIVIVLLWFVISKTANPTTHVASPVTRVPTPTTQPRSEMWLDPAQLTLPLGRSVEIMVMIDAHNMEIYGSDAIINYDPTLLRVVSVEEPIEPNRQFSMYDRQSDGQIQISTVKSTADSAKIPQMTLARITFESLRAGVAHIDFEYAPRATNKSTIISTRNNENILDAVRGTTITIQ